MTTIAAGSWSHLWRTLLAIFLCTHAWGGVIEPSSGPVGTQVVVTLAGLDSSTVTGAKLGLVPATIVDRPGPESVRIAIPASAPSATITLFMGAESRTTPLSFEVTRLVPVSVAVGFPLVNKIGTLFGDSAGGQIQIAIGRASLVFGSSNGTGPPLLAIATDADNSIVLSAANTARAVMFLSPLVYTVDSPEAEERLQVLASLNETNALAGFLQDELQVDHDYTATATFKQHLGSVLTAYLAASAPPPPLAAPPPGLLAPVRASEGGFVKRDLTTAGFDKLDRVQPTEHEAVLDEKTGLPILTQSYGASPLPVAELGEYLTANPLEWSANLYALSNTDSLLNTRAKAMNLAGDHSQVYQRLAPEAIDRVIIGAEPASRYIAFAGMAKSWLAERLLGDIKRAAGPTTKAGLNIPDDAPGLYMVRSFNGARFDRQADLINNLPGGKAEDTRLLTLNIVMAVNDALSIFVSGRDWVDESDWAALLVNLEFAVGAALDVQAAQGTLDGAVVRAIFLAAVETAYDFIADNMIEEGLESLTGRLAGLFKSVIDISGKISNAGKLFERVNALTNGVQMFNKNVYTIQSVEDTLIIVGDPWAPAISSFQPLRARRGDPVTIIGAGFSTTAAENIVTIGYLGTSPESPSAAEKAQVVTATATSLLVHLPAGANSGVITVHVVNKGNAYTTNLPAPYQQFEVIPDPFLASINPAAAAPGQRVRLTGLHIPRLATTELDERLSVGFTLNGTESFLTPIAATPTELIVQVPFNVGTGTVRLRYLAPPGGPDPRYSNSIPYTVANTGMPPQGAEIRFSPSGDSNTADDTLTLREALMLKNGTLAYSSLTTPPVPRPPGTTYETDWVSSNAVGTGVRNNIFATLASNTTYTLTLSSPLPPLASHTSLYINRASLIGTAPVFIIDGNGVATGLLLNGAEKVSATLINLKNFSEAAIRITGGSHDNSFFGSVEGGAGHGVHLLDDACRNYIDTPVKNVGGHGWLLTGAAVCDNELLVDQKPATQNAFIENCGGWGIRVENGAHLNRILAPRDAIFTPPPSGGIIDCDLGGISIAGAGSYGNSIHQMFSVGLPVRNNTGPGIRIESPHTMAYLCRVTGNTGNGIEVVGSAAADSRIRGCTIGYDWTTGAAAANGGHGILISNSQQIEIGEPIDHDPAFANPPYNGIGANSGSGIVIQNSHHVTLHTTFMGRVPSSTWTPSNRTIFDLPNSASGLILDNSRDCVIGSAWFGNRLQITGHLAGSGIRLTGASTTGNIIMGARVGQDPFATGTDLGNNIGIEVMNGAWGNRFGVRGRGTTGGSGAAPANYCHYNRVAGVSIDSGLDPTQTIPVGGPTIEPVGENIVVNTSCVFNHDAGIVLKSGARATQVGGVRSEANAFNGNGKVGLKIDGVVPSREELGNRVIGNQILNNGGAAANPLTGEDGVDVLIKNSTFQKIGGDRLAEGNTFGNLWTGVLVVGGSDNVISFNGANNMRNAGIVLRDTTNNRVGPGNEITNLNQAGGTPIGGIVVSGGSNNRIIGNRIGSTRAGLVRTILTNGISLRDTVGNVVGGFGADANIINNASTYGIGLTGAACTSNRVAGNWIGHNPGPGPAIQPNLGGGIFVDAGAHHNTIGGSLPIDFNGAVAQLPVGNMIYSNTGEGVRVSGAAAVSNTITHNSISGNDGLGIFLGGGNLNQPEPSLTALPGQINGTSTAPNGSLIQVFQDTGGEGKWLLGETTVQAGAFQFMVPPLMSINQITATVTHATTGNTSQFATPVTLPPLPPLLLHVTRTGNPAALQAAPGATVVVVPLKLENGGDTAVRVTRMRFDFTGTAIGAVAEAGLYLDGNENGRIDAEDTLIKGPITSFTSGADFTGPVVVVPVDEPVHVLLAVRLATSATNGQQVAFDLTAVADVTALALLGPAPVTVTGDFVVEGDSLTVNPAAATNYLSWAGGYFTLPELATIGTSHYDADFDGLTNCEEYFHGTHPRVSTPAPMRSVVFGGMPGFAFEHVDRADLDWSWKESFDLIQWMDLTSGISHPPTASGDGRMTEVMTFDTVEQALFFRLFIERTE